MKNNKQEPWIHIKNVLKEASKDVLNGFQEISFKLMKPKVKK